METERTARGRGLRWRVAGAVLLALSIVFGVLLLVPPEALTSPAALIRHLQTAAANHELAAPAVFFLVYIAVCAMSLPGATALTLAAGGIFGIGRGIVLVSCASTLGAVIAVGVARMLLRDRIIRRYPQFGRRVDATVGEDGAWFLFALRLVPGMPFFLLNLAVSLTRLPLRTIAWVSQLGMLPATALYVTAGSEAAAVIADRQPVSWRAIALLAGIALLILAGRLARRRFRTVR